MTLQDSLYAPNGGGDWQSQTSDPARSVNAGAGNTQNIQLNMSQGTR